MSDAVRFDSPLPLDEGRLRVLVTGAAGKVGSGFAAHAAEGLDLVLTDRPGVDMSAVEPYGEVIACDLGDLPGLTNLCRKVDTVLHLGAVSHPSAAWKSLLEANIIGTYHVFAASKAAGCRRVVFASSVHAVSGYRVDRQIAASDPVNPGNLYGVSKCFGEALGRYMAEQQGLSVIAVRIGAFQTLEAAARPSSAWMFSVFIAPEDLYQLLHRCIRVRNLQFAVFHGVGDNRCKRLDIGETQELLGYVPAYDYTDIPPTLRAAFQRVPRVREVRESGLRGDF